MEEPRESRNEEGMPGLLDGWAESQACAPNETPFFLEPEYVASAGQDSGLDPELMTAMVHASGQINAEPATQALAWHVYYRLFRAPTAPDSQVKQWPMTVAALGDATGLLYLLTLFGGLPELRTLYQTHQVPDWVARDTLYDVQRWADHYRRRHGSWGIGPEEVAWLRLHLRGELYGLGRLQFQPGSWVIPARAFRHRPSGAVVALSEDGVRYRPDGQLDGAGGVRDLEGSWTAHLQLGATWVVGHRVTPAGWAERAETRLARSEWAEVLKPGDPVLHVHIPSGTPLDMEACRRSLDEAFRFFTGCFPQRPFTAFACDSWLLDAQLEALLPPSSNLVRFLRQMYLVPVVSDRVHMLNWVFGGIPQDLAQAPRDTALRRALLDHMLRGGELRGGGCFLLPDDLPAWGTDIYRQP
ncbi:MAG: hypothetical protein JWO59_556 [Chloroflexi bacterium]|nr:hypothetical protein [Chloroflexota bacterium]